MGHIINGLILVVVLTNISYPQGIFLDKGDSGIAFHGGISEDRIGINPVASIGYSFKGLVDIGFSIRRDKFNDLRSVGQFFDYSGIAIHPSLSIGSVKDNLVALRQSTDFLHRKINSR